MVASPSDALRVPPAPRRTRESGPTATAGGAVRSERALTAARARRRIGWMMPATSFDGALVVLFYLGWVLPSAVSAPQRAHWQAVNLVAFAGYLAACHTIGSVWCRRSTRRALGWMLDDRAPTVAEAQLVLRLPRAQVAISGTLWAGAVVVFGLVNAHYSARWGIDVAVTILLGGMSTCALGYLLTEWVLRPVFAETLAASPLTRSTCLGVGARMLLTWTFTTGIPVLGIGMSMLAAQHHAELVGPTVFLVVVALASGITGSFISTRAVADPLRRVRRAMHRVESGDLDVAVRVDDATEVGAMQAGFNEMVAGLRERRRLADLFGRHVGEPVVERALQRGAELGGETLDVAVLFVDIRGSTTLAAQRPAEEVVTSLNRFFGVVVSVVEQHGGWVNKFEGDAALCVFGAPVSSDTCADDALRAARALRARLAELTDIDAGIGVAAGPVVAGNIGSMRRYEYTVIGDPVNEAARLSEVAKTAPARVAASDQLLARASAEEAARWAEGEPLVLRGRTAVATVAHPR